MDIETIKIAVVIPCYKVSQSLKSVLNDIGSEVTSIPSLEFSIEFQFNNLTYNKDTVYWRYFCCLNFFV